MRVKEGSVLAAEKSIGVREGEWGLSLEVRREVERCVGFIERFGGTKISGAPATNFNLYRLQRIKMDLLLREGRR